MRPGPLRHLHVVTDTPGTTIIHPDPILTHPINHPTRITNPIKETP